MLLLYGFQFATWEAQSRRTLRISFILLKCHGWKYILSNVRKNGAKDTLAHCLLEKIITNKSKLLDIYFHGRIIFSP